MSTEKRKETVRLMIEEVWNRKRVDLLPDLYHSDAKVHLNEGYIEGYDRLRDEFILPTLDAFPDMHHEILEFIVDGDCVAMRYRGSGTHQRDSGGKSATGKTMRYEGITVFHLKDNKVQEVWNHSNWSDAFAGL